MAELVSLYGVKILVLSAIAVCFFCSDGKAQSVAEAYLGIPNDMVGYPDGRNTEQKQADLKKNPPKKGSGTLSISGEVQISKYKTKNGAPIFVVAGGSFAEDRLKRLASVFQLDEKGKWADVTDRYLPPLPEMVVNALFRKACKSKKSLTDSASGTYRYVLPSKKGPIKGFVESDVAVCKRAIFKLSFDGYRFNMRI